MWDFQHSLNSNLIGLFVSLLRSILAAPASS